MAPDRSERDRPRPMAGGDLRTVPLSHVFLHLYAKQLHGTLLVRPVGRPPILVKVERGRPRALRCADVASGDLQALLMPLCGLKEGEYEFYAADLMATPGPAVRGSVDPLSLVSAASRDFPRDDIAGALLARYGTRRMRLQPGQPIDRLGLDRRQKTLVDLLRAGPESVAVLIKLSPLPLRETQNLLYLFVITKIVAPMAKAASEEISATSHRSPSRSSSSVLSPSAQSTSASHVRMSSVIPSAPPGAASTRGSTTVQGANSEVSFAAPDGQTVDLSTGRRPVQQRPVSHAGPLSTGPLSMPPGVAEREGGPLSAAPRRSNSMAVSGVSSMRPDSGRPGSMRPSSAKDAARRSTQQSIAPRYGSGRPSRSVSAPITPGEQFKLAEKRLLAGYPGEALTIVDALLKTDPKRANLLGLRAQALFVAMRTPEGQAVAEEVSKAIQEALVVDEEEPRALYAKGLSFQQVGKLKLALRFFRRACEADKSFIAAKRDAHIVETRLRQRK